MAIYYDISMDDGHKEKLTLNLGSLLELSKRDKPVADRYFELYAKMQTKKHSFNELEMGEVIYIAYRCANLKNEDPMSLEDFLFSMTDSRVEIANTFSRLFGTQEKKQVFPMRSGKQHRK